MKFYIKVFLVVCLIGFGFSNESMSQSSLRPSKSTEGVVLHGCYEGMARLENTNDYSVRIRRVWQAQGETTRSIDRLEPGGELTLTTISSQDGFYIYTMDGVMVGWFTGSCPKK